ncbi:hypothetical protein L7F22_007854 [Adiantum nelumboides]|nr:hypothetical protein [Adiantum nelumboides]
MVLGATNRPNDIDSAILRRMPKRYAVRLPDPSQRRKILEIMLADTRLDPRFDYDEVVRRTEGYSGSDLKEACRNAAMQPVREYMRSAEGRKQISSNSRRGSSDSPVASSPPTPTKSFQTRPISNRDFFVSDTATAATTLKPARLIGEDPLD